MQLSGVYAPLPTPFDDDDRLDVDRLKRSYERFAAGPLAGFVVLGSNGEAALMDDDESDRAIAAARDVIPRGRPFIVGTGRESTSAAIAAARRAADLGADAVLVRTPGFFKAQMTADVFVRHYTAVADASPVPVLLYNFTAVTGVNLPVAAVARLAAHPNIAGMKESGGDVAQLADWCRARPRRFSVLAGSASTIYAALCVGVAGGILALAAVVPEPASALCADAPGAPRRSAGAAAAARAAGAAAERPRGGRPQGRLENRRHATPARRGGRSCRSPTTPPSQLSAGGLAA